MPAPVFATGDVPSADQVNKWFVNVTFARKTATESVSGSTALQDDDHLFVTVDASTVYELTAVLRYDGDAAGDLQIGWTVPAGATLDYWGSGLTVTGANYSDDQNGAFDLTTSVVAFGAIGVGTTCTVRLGGLLVTAGTAGTVRLRWAQRTAFATATRLFTNSFVSLRRVG
ncbi:hypothetical protein [Micromonospora cathayae]|uniref:Uncharacterized protein n=1 Tax=Micromonospora cathayae TaxID=3028804 RepID=A0ABY7ZZ61_9ACTN|nr:hypothetical protein [Micromonospora sp. HUAS 3]WDZ87179.1 hypothetical protein PVK37_12625 [Micromonospora sp. HUAS 3]